MFFSGFGLLFSLQLLASYRLASSIARQHFHLKQQCRCHLLPHTSRRRAWRPPCPPPAAPAACCGKQPLCSLRRAFPPSPDPPFWSMLVQSNSHFSTAISGLHSKLLKKKGKQGLLAEGCRCSALCLRLKK